jgi:Flp pilus assembly protein TadG
MTKTPAVPTRRRSERGIALAYFGIIMIMLIGFVVIGVDVARLAFTASEVQSIADSAALAAIGDYAANKADPTAHTKTIVADNTVDGRAGTIASGTTAGIELLEAGTYDWNTKAFAVGTWGTAGINAARAHGKGTVTNLVAAAIGVVNSSVHRQAIAAVGGACNEVAALPIAIEQQAIQQYINSPDCENIPVTRLFQVPTDNSCFTSLSTAAAGSSSESAHVPAACCKGNKCGGGQTASLNIGDPIALNNGQDATVLQIIAGCATANPPLTQFVVPVVPNNSCAGGKTQNVQLFARIIIDHVVTTGAASKKGVYIKGVCLDQVSGNDPGCLSAGEQAMALVQ